MKYILRHHFWVYGPITGGSYNPVVQTVVQHKTLMFHNFGDVDNYIRTKVNAQSLIKLEIEYATVE